MNQKKDILYLLQVALPFAILSYWKHPAFSVPVILIFLSLPFPRVRTALIQGWQSLGMLTGKCVAPVILTTLYYLALTPLAFLRRLFSNDELRLKKSSISTLIARESKASVESFDDLW